MHEKQAFGVSFVLPESQNSLGRSVQTTIQCHFPDRDINFFRSIMVDSSTKCRPILHKRPDNVPLFDVMLCDGLERLFDFIPIDLCTFIVDGEHFPTSFAEAIVISPMACDVLKCNPMNRTFFLPEHSVDPKTF
jgi:hypothetical protein